MGEQQVVPYHPHRMGMAGHGPLSIGGGGSHGMGFLICDISPKGTSRSYNRISGPGKTVALAFASVAGPADGVYGVCRWVGTGLFGNFLNFPLVATAQAAIFLY